jgi:hypothetical protein
MPYSPEIPELTDTDLRHCLGSPVEMLLPLISPPCTVEMPSLPDITLPPPTLRRGVETVVVDPDITGIDFCLDAHRT